MNLSETLPRSQSLTWQWQGFPIRYQSAGDTGPAILCIHGFGASSDHWRKNLPELALNHRVYAIDLIGFGRSAKPTPHQDIEYCFETWAQQILDFCQEVIGTPVFLVGNSIGCIAALQAAVMNPEQVQGVVMIDCSLRLLHVRKRSAIPWARRTFAPLFQRVLGVRAIGHFFFQRLAQPKVIRRILTQAYARKEAVTDELVNLLIAPARDLGAADVFLAFIQYDQGPLAEDLLPLLTCPVLCLWGTEDPWEPIEMGRAFTQYSAVTDFIPLEGVGHCGQDEAPELVNPILTQWVEQQLSSENSP
jgi:pimeloyl-ACP methyl ester carboxylesterase